MHCPPRALTYCLLTTHVLGRHHSAGDESHSRPVKSCLCKLHSFSQLDLNPSPFDFKPTLLAESLALTSQLCGLCWGRQSATKLGPLPLALLTRLWHLTSPRSEPGFPGPVERWECSRHQEEVERGISKDWPRGQTQGRRGDPVHSCCEEEKEPGFLRQLICSHHPHKNP